MLTQKTRYAIYAMVNLARGYGAGPIPILRIAEEEKIPKRFLENILLDLKNNGFLNSRLGKNGGYYLNKPPGDINLLEIVRLFEGAIALLPCISEKYYESCHQCRDEMSCAIMHTFKDIRENTYIKLASTSLASLV
jgi:Rrf2 family protein